MNCNSDAAGSYESFGHSSGASLGHLARFVGNGLERGLHDTDTVFNVTTEIHEITISGKKFPVRPSPIKYVHVAKTHTNHTYRDFTNMPLATYYAFPERIENMTFHERLYHMLTLNTTERSLAIAWCCHGRAFHIPNAVYLEHMGVLRCYFGFNSPQRFRKQLNNYGYKQLVGSSSSECYYSEFGPPSVNRRRLLPDPSNEPNFDQISMLFPLPGDRRALVAEARRRLESRRCFISDDVVELVVARKTAMRRPKAPPLLPRRETEDYG